MLRMRTIRSTNGARKVRTPAGAVHFDESRGHIARVAEPVADRLVGEGLAYLPGAEELCPGRHSVRRRSGLGDVLCLSAAIKQVIALGGQCDIVTHHNYRTVFDGLPNGDVEWAATTPQPVVLEAWLEKHPGRWQRPAAMCFGDYWNLDLDDVRPHFAVSDRERAAALERADGWRDDGEPVVALFLKAGWATRTYQHFMRVAHSLAHEGCAVIGFGDEVLPCCRKPPGMSVRELGALLSVCDLVVSGDTGPMHLAAAVGTPAVAVFGASSAAGSVGPGYDVTALEPEGMSCWPCWQADCIEGDLDVPGSCVRAVEPERVVEAALGRLRSSTPQSADKGAEQ